ncbi:MAG TPA: hypothetical protein VEQ58_11660, partial [Polyangiaceae bacterium]|nr:hypothetical protein [Polyangiaceae bacterium]
SIAAACSASPVSEPAPARLSGSSSRQRVAQLRARENALRAHFSPRTQPPWLDVSGADPYRLVANVGGGFVGILRGSRALVRLDTNLAELERVALPMSPTALCVAETGEAWVGSRYDQRLLRVRGTDSSVVSEQPAGIADLACGEKGLVYVLPTDGSELLTLDASGKVRARRPALSGGLRVVRRGRYLLESSLFERSVRVLGLDSAGLPTRELARIRHDGSLWAVDAVERGGELLLAVAGVEDRPLVRAHGEFENIDSFVWLYRLREGKLQQLCELDVSDLGLVVPKALQLSATNEGLRLTALAAGSGRSLRATWSSDLGAPPQVETSPAPPGVADAVFDDAGNVAYGSPLLDAWIQLDAAGQHLTRVDAASRPAPEVRLGEALFFTELMAPENVSRGSHSRFTCETCHFEGGVDGRVHFSGRADISVVTKPLLGLANNRPHFSRAMDPDLSSASHNEFRVAGAGSGTDPWFSLESARFPWLHDLGVDRAQLDPLDLREALLDFLYAFSHAPNPRSQGRSSFSALESAGARAFLDHCERCHQARLVSDDPSTSVPFEDWQSLIFSRNAPLVWARGNYEKTGILPYVHEKGTRVTSLRRLALKPRYFTNGSAADLATVLARFREGPRGAWHDAPGEAELRELSLDTRSALLALLQLL